MWDWVLERIKLTKARFLKLTFKYFIKILGHPGGILSLWQYLQQLSIWDKEKSGKEKSLFLQVIVETLVDKVQQLTWLLQFFQNPLKRMDIEYMDVMTGGKLLSI